MQIPATGASEPTAWVFPAWQRKLARPFAIVAALSVIVGGLIAAVSSPLGWPHGSWAAAYLVLVGGVAQSALIAGRLTLAGDRSEERGSRLWPLCVLWNVATLLVIGGTLGESFVLVLAGSLGLLIVLVAFWPTGGTGGSSHRAWRLIFRLFLVFLALSTVTGVLLALR